MGISLASVPCSYSAHHSWLDGQPSYDFVLVSCYFFLVLLYFAWFPRLDCPPPPAIAWFIRPCWLTMLVVYDCSSLCRCDLCINISVYSSSYCSAVSSPSVRCASLPLASFWYSVKSSLLPHIHIHTPNNTEKCTQPLVFQLISISSLVVLRYMQCT